MKILLAEDEWQMSNVLTTAMTHQGYDVDVVFNGQEAIDKAKDNAYDIMILDIMMPIKSGIETLKEIRASGNCSHIIMLTAMAEINDRVTGLDAGADDYLTKPFSLKELLARLRSMERRVESFTPQVLQFAGVTLNINEQELSAGNAIRLASKEGKLMAFLMLNQGKYLDTKTLYQHVWSDQEDYDTSIVWVYISYLRQKLLAIQANVIIAGDKDTSYCLLEK
ncbi:DNA-binding response regulator [Streptococcus pyogenes]|uniref:response regulator transcription factor n=1 Tax=Streptococcus pyogenes TaxID=1314 RepID=UPI0010A1E879|nr:response regulator transcription factor [Streptococcus pyogenes]VHM14509.1 DNA-binding response regulator [Streptococcus pyogenes]VHM46638.1 DNA-binding response regulator [Streptococcus pyogenes]